MKHIIICAGISMLFGMTTALALPNPSSSTYAIDGDGGRIALPRVPGFSGTLTFPPNDAGEQTRVALRASLQMPADAPLELRAAFAAQPGPKQLRLWISAEANDDVRFLAGDVGFDFSLAHLIDADGVRYDILACDRSACKPRRIGPIYASGNRLAFTNAGTPFHFHFNVARGHEYVAAIVERRCTLGDCER